MTYRSSEGDIEISGLRRDWEALTHCSSGTTSRSISGFHIPQRVSRLHQPMTSARCGEESLLLSPARSGYSLPQTKPGLHGRVFGVERVRRYTGPSLSASVGDQSIQSALTVEDCLSTLKHIEPIQSVQVIRRLSQEPIIEKPSRIATWSITVMNAEVLSS